MPDKLEKKNVFTIGAVDNIDHNPSSGTSKGSFHGTGISIFQPILSLDEGIERTFKTGGFTSGTDKVLQELLHVDTNISFFHRDPPTQQNISRDSYEADKQLIKEQTRQEKT